MTSTISKPIHDPYFNTRRCVQRMLGWYKQHGNLIILFDYDDTVFDFHKRGFLFSRVIKLLQECSELGFVMILFTGHTDKDYATLKEDLLEIGIRVDYINESPAMKTIKPYGNILLDDKAGLRQAYEILRRTVNKITLEKGK